MAFIVGAPLLLAMLAAPIGFAFTNFAKADPVDLYIIVGSSHDLKEILTNSFVQEIGPYTAPLAKMVMISPEFHNWLVERGYWVFPAGRLAELCGIVPDG